MSDLRSPSSPSSRRIGALDDNKDKRNAKLCNCKKSNCLKLYCECFANGVYCQVGKCNCVSCQNNLDNNEMRRQAVEATLERNPNSFRSKMFINDKSNDKAGKNTTSKLHKGCHCKKSYCLKKYCECFQAGIVCTDRCRCLACKNFEGSTKRIEAAARIELKEKQALLEFEHNNELISQRALASASESPNDQVLDYDCGRPAAVSTGSIGAWEGGAQQGDGIKFESADVVLQNLHFFEDENIRRACQLLYKKSVDITRAVTTNLKRKVADVEDEGDAGEKNAGGVAREKTRSKISVDGMKLEMLEYFSENLQELIVKSLASKISENSNSNKVSSVSSSSSSSTLAGDKAVFTNHLGVCADALYEDGEDEEDEDEEEENSDDESGNHDDHDDNDDITDRHSNFNIKKEYQ